MSTQLNPQEKVSGEEIVAAFESVNGVHPGFRPAHAKGALLLGTFTPTPAAASLTRAPHAHRASTPVTVRLSDFAGVPTVPDNDPSGAGPRGMAIRFHLGEHVHTDIVAHSIDSFPTRTAEEFVEFLRAISLSGPAVAKPKPIEIFLSTHPKALEFALAPKPIPVSFAKEAFFAVSAFKFTDENGTVRFGRFRIRPVDGTEYLDETSAAAKEPNFLFDELKSRLARGPVSFQIFVQLAEAGDVVDDATVRWPADRTEILFGTVALNKPVPENDIQAARMIYDPIPRVEGIEPAGDPLFEPRADAYLFGGRKRRAALAKKD